MSRNERIAWAAGFFDGEGNVLIKKSAKRGQFWLVLTVTQVSIEPLLIFKELFGGAVRPKKTSNERWANQFVWVASSQHAIGALREMAAYLTVKAPHVPVAEEFVSRLGPRGQQPKGTSRPTAEFQRLKELMSSLNVRGPAREKLPAITQRMLTPGGEQMRLIS